MLYRLHDVQKVLGRRTVLDIQSLEIPARRVIALVGPNGAGKTTLLEILAFLSAPTRGRIVFRGESIGRQAKVLRAYRRLVVLVQQRPILFSTTVERNVAYPLGLRGVPRAEREAVVGRLLEVVGLSGLRRADARGLSGGETQRVAVARALACRPQVILLDEPTTGVDREHRHVLERLVRRINREEGISIVFTTHDPLQADRLGDETVYLVSGKPGRGGLENIFSAQLEKDECGHTWCVLRDNMRLRLTGGDPGRVQVILDPEKLRLQPPGPGENRLPGRLVQLSELEGRIRAVVDVGIPLSLRITPQHLPRLAECLGKPLAVHCPADAVQVIEQEEACRSANPF